MRYLAAGKSIAEVKFHDGTVAVVFDDRCPASRAEVLSKLALVRDQVDQLERHIRELPR